jgi:hypothetical protein
MLPLGGPHRSLSLDTGDVPRHSLLNTWRLRGHTRVGGGDLHVLSLHMMGRGIPAPTPSDMKWDVGVLPPVPSIDRVTDRSKSGRPAHVHQWAAHDLPLCIKCDWGGWSAAHKCAWWTALSPAQVPTWLPHGGRARASGAVQPLGPPVGGGGGGGGRPLLGRTRVLPRGVGPPGRVAQEGLPFSLAQVPPGPYH